MKIHGTFYQNDVKDSLQMFGPMSVQQIKAKLALKKLNVDETQILEALDILIRRRYISGNNGVYSYRSF